MLVLTTVNDSVTLVTSNAVSTDWVVSYGDLSGTALTPGSGQGNVASATTTTIVSAPGAGVSRQIKSMLFVNKDATNSQIVQLFKVNSGNSYAITEAITLAAGQSLRVNQDADLIVDTITNPMTTLGDMIYGSAGGVFTRLAGNTASTQGILTSTGTGSAANAPGWTLVSSIVNVGSAKALVSPSTTGLVEITGMTAGQTRVKTVNDTNDTLLELGGSYTPTGTWNWGSATISGLSVTSVKSTTTTGVVQFTGMSASATDVKTVRDASDTILELGGSYTPTGTWVWTSASVTWPTFNQSTTGSAQSVKSPSTTGLIEFTGMATGTTRIKTVGNANDTLLELTGSYSPYGTYFYGNDSNVNQAITAFTNSALANTSTLTNFNIGCDGGPVYLNLWANCNGLTPGGSGAGLALMSGQYNSYVSYAYILATDGSGNLGIYSYNPSSTGPTPYNIPLWIASGTSGTITLGYNSTARMTHLPCTIDATTTTSNACLQLDGGLAVAKSVFANNFNALTLTANSTGFSIAGGSSSSKTLQINNTLTHAGTDGTTQNFPPVTINVGGAIWTKTTATTLSNWNTAATILGAAGTGVSPSGTPSLTLPANFLTVGRTIRFKLWGVFGTHSSAPSVTMAFNMNGGNICTTGSQALAPGSVTTIGWHAECDITCLTTGGSGTVIGNGYLQFAYDTAGAGSSQTFPFPAFSTSAITIDTTSTIVLDVTLACSSKQTDNTAGCYQAIIETVG